MLLMCVQVLLQLNLFVFVEPQKVYYDQSVSVRCIERRRCVFALAQCAHLDILCTRLRSYWHWCYGSEEARCAEIRSVDRCPCEARRPAQMSIYCTAATAGGQPPSTAQPRQSKTAHTTESQAWSFLLKQMSVKLLSITRWINTSGTEPVTHRLKNCSVYIFVPVAFRDLSGGIDALSHHSLLHIHSI